MYEYPSSWILCALVVWLLALLLYVRWWRADSRAHEAEAAALAKRRASVRVVRAQTRHPIVLAHGWGEFHRLIPEELGYGYFRGIPAGLRASGHTVHVVRVPPTASIERRAAQLELQIKQLDARVNIVAHSMVGLAALLAIARHGLDQHVASLTTIGTPHNGTPLADAALSFDFPKSRELLAKLGVDLGGVYDLSAARTREFNQLVLDAPNVLYANVIAAVNLDAGGVHALLAPAHRYLLRTAGPNDGVVPASSQRWGETLEEIDADHWAQIGWFARFDVQALYARIAQHLIARER